MPVYAIRTIAFPDASIEVIDAESCPELECIDEEVTLIKSFRQPFPLRERDKPVMDGEMVAYG
jgi:hypothetical protein